MSDPIAAFRGAVHMPGGGEAMKVIVVLLALTLLDDHGVPFVPLV